MIYEDIKNQTSVLNSELSELLSLIDQLPNNSEMEDQIGAINVALNNIYDWATEGEKASLLNSFLTDLKALFTNYSTTLSIVQGTPAYGENYGEAADKLKFVISKDGVSAEKVFDKDSINQEDV